MIYKLPYDKKEKDFILFLKLAENGGHAIDIGANIGVMTYHFAKKSGNTIVHSFEPVPLNYGILQRVVQKYKLKNVLTYNLALGDKKGSVGMLIPQKGDVILHGLSHISDKKGSSEGEQVSIEMDKLDDVQEIKDKPVTAIKIDVEGYEFFVLQGAKNLIQQNKPAIYMELWDSDMRDKCIELLESWGYKGYINKKGQLKLYSGEKYVQNFFFIHKECTERMKLL